MIDKEKLRARILAEPDVDCEIGAPMGERDVTYLPPTSELRAWADNPAASGYVPVHPVTLRAIADSIDALQERVVRAEDLLQRSRRYVAAHDYKARGMLTGPPPVGGVLRDLLAAIDASLSAKELEPPTGESE